MRIRKFCENERNKKKKHKFATEAEDKLRFLNKSSSDTHINEAFVYVYLLFRFSRQLLMFYKNLFFFDENKTEMHIFLAK